MKNSNKIIFKLVLKVQLWFLRIYNVNAAIFIAMMAVLLRFGEQYY